MKVLDWLYEKLNPFGDDFFGEAAKAQIEEAKRHEEMKPRSWLVNEYVARAVPFEGSTPVVVPAGGLCPVCARKRAQAKERMRRVRARKREAAKSNV